MQVRLTVVLAALVCLTACDDTVVVQLQTGPQRIELAASALSLPAQLRDESGGAPRIASVPCGAMGMCPTIASTPITCEGGICDPAPVTLTAAVGGVVDFDVLAAEARDLVRQVDAIEVVQASYTIASSSLTFDVPELEVFWGPEGAAAVDPAMGVARLGTLPAIPRGSPDPGDMILDPSGVAAMSSYLVGTSRRVRFFARTRIDLAPGGPYPDGMLVAHVNLRVRMVGSVVR